MRLKRVSADDNIGYKDNRIAMMVVHDILVKNISMMSLCTESYIIITCFIV